MAIDIGPEAEDRDASYAYSNDTLINKDNPANASGTITGIEIWSVSNLEGCRVGTFYTTNGNTLKCRDSAVIGAVTSGSKQTFTEDSESNPLAITVEIGDYIGMYYDSGSMEVDTDGFAGLWKVDGEYIDADDEATYTLYATSAISLKGTGEEVAPPAGRSFGFIIG